MAQCAAVDCFVVALRAPVLTQPGVKDTQVEMLIDEKVDAFWKGVENGTNKRGQVNARSISQSLSRGR